MEKPIYYVHYTTADKITGPYHEINDTLLWQTEEMRGTGHSLFLPQVSGDTLVVFHAWDIQMKKRKPHAKRVSFQGDTIVVFE
ncbi:hypothetical protein HX109_11755 [Galbibacter sp. BG1]|uniref:hypothetical protein n=1 Tax=Galbibacter sp. BG1 TaxID=1170699 RepID=UPI0015BD1EE4|nr:hypothetical protein [Galbibacter sp. BG1]QLE02197.1 hypothetical protein HX109_11755 [Galbibacter sp. BG1]